MIDGVKIRCVGVNACDWEDNNLLVFSTYIDVQTGEVLGNGKRIAFYNGLQFHLIPSTISNTTHCYIKGSLAKYYTRGETNAFDFNAYMLLEVVNDLQYNFKVDPERAVLENLEYGLNIIPPIEVKAVLKGLIAYKNNGFKAFSIANKALGQCIGMPNYQTIKFYNKTAQDPKAPKNMLRLEVAIKRMSIISRYEIKTLADLTALKVTPLLFNIKDIWDECIYTEEKQKYKEMTGFERNKWLFYINPKKWEDLEKKQRYRMKKHFHELNIKYGTAAIQAEISSLIMAKINELAAGTTFKDVHLLHNFWEGNNSIIQKAECPPFTCLDKEVKSTQNKTRNKSETKKVKSEENTVRKKHRKCLACKARIELLKSTAVYCSKKCNNSYHAGIRKQTRQRNKLQEKKHLAMILTKGSRVSFWVLISYTSNDQSESVMLRPSEILLEEWKSIGIQSLILIEETSKKEIVLTSYRARNYIKSISSINSKGYEKAKRSTKRRDL